MEGVNRDLLESASQSRITFRRAVYVRRRDTSRFRDEANRKRKYAGSEITGSR